MDYKALFLAIYIVVFLYQLMLRVIEYRSQNNPVPPNVIDVYDPETYRTWRAYHGEKCRLRLIEHIVGFIVEFALLLFNAYAAFAGLFVQKVWEQMFAVLLLAQIASLVSVPFDWYDTMKIEARYGFNRTSVK